MARVAVELKSAIKITEPGTEGVIYEGILTEKRSVQNKETKKFSSIYSVRQNDGTVQEIWGFIELDKKMQHIPLYSKVWITFEGTETIQGEKGDYTSHHVCLEFDNGE